MHRPGHREHGDEVEQDRREHLRYAAAHAQRRGDPRPERTRRGADRERERQRDRAGLGREPARHERRRCERSDVELALAADVPDPAAERQRDAEPDEEQRAHTHDGVLERDAVAERTGGKRREGRERIRADRREQHGRRRERDGGRPERLREPAHERHDTPSPSISRPIASRVCASGATGRSRPRNSTAMRMPSSSTSSSSVEIRSTAVPARTSRRSSSRTAAVAATSSPRVGFDRDEHPRSAAQGARHTQLLLIAARERARGVLGPRLDLEALDRRARRVVKRRDAHEPRGEHGRTPTARGFGQHQVLLDGEVEHEPRAVAVAREQRERRPQHAQASRLERAHAGEQLLERALPVPVDARERDELARAHLEVDAGEPVRTHTRERERDGSGLDGRRTPRRRQRVAHHQAAELPRVEPFQ